MDLLAAYRSFVAVAERGNFSAAARSLGQSQPTISRRVAELEKHLGASLLDRTTRSVALTGEGEDLLVRARAILQQIDEAEQAVGSRARSLDGVLRVLSHSALGRILLVPRLCQFMGMYPGVEVQLKLVEDLDGVGEPAFDVVMTAGPQRLRTDRTQKIGDVPKVLVAAPRLIERFGAPRTVDDLARMPAIELVAPGAHRASWRLERGAEHKEIGLRARFRSDRDEAALAALIEGAGVGLVPLWLVQRALDERHLWRLLPQWHGGLVPVHLSSPQDPAPNARARAFIDFLVPALRRERIFA